MRKFTKDISALLASVAVGTAAFAGAIAASAEQSEKPAGSQPEKSTQTTTVCETQTAGVAMIEDWEEQYPTDPVGTMMAPETTTTVRETYPIGTMMAEETTTTVTYRPTEVVGTMMAEDETETTATTTTVIPPVAGETMPPEETDPLPPLAGDIAPADGDINGDGDFGVTDIVVFQKWLHGDSRTKIQRWAADFNYDGEVDVFDLGLMKRELIRRHRNYTEPDHWIAYGSMFQVDIDQLPLYAEPDLNSRVLKTIPHGEFLREAGYQDDTGDWLFTEYNGQYGWIPMETEDGRMTIYFAAEADKPVIYLYPETATDVHVELELTESDLSTTYPRYQDGWDVTAYPDGTLLNKADGTRHKYLFWDSTNCRTRYDLSKGFCVAGSDTERFLKETLTGMGLTEEEMNEFIVYWLPRMEHNAYNLITFQSDAYTNAAKLHITPEPDSLCRIFMVYAPLEQAVEIEPQQFSAFERNGFTVVEWGGSEIV